MQSLWEQWVFVLVNQCWTQCQSAINNYNSMIDCQCTSTKCGTGCKCDTQCKCPCKSEDSGKERCCKWAAITNGNWMMSWNSNQDCIFIVNGEWLC